MTKLVPIKSKTILLKNTFEKTRGMYMLIERSKFWKSLTRD